MSALIFLFDFLQIPSRVLEMGFFMIFLHFLSYWLYIPILFCTRQVYMIAIDHPDLISQIHPINAAHLLQTQPHRVYGDVWGNLLEIIVERFARSIVDTLYDHGGIIAVAYHHATTDGEQSFENTYLLRPDGQIRWLHSHYGELPIGIEWDLYYMLLNPVGINNWIEQDIRQLEEERRGFGRYGMGIDIPEWAPRRGLKEVIIRAKSHYERTIGR